MFKRKSRIREDKSMIPFASEAESPEGAIDVSKIQVVTGLSPVAGVMKRNSGDIVPTIFVDIESADSLGKTHTVTLAFNPMGLATSANLLSAIALVVISDPESLVKEISDQHGLTKGKEPAKTAFNGYL